MSFQSRDYLVLHLLSFIPTILIRPSSFILYPSSLNDFFIGDIGFGDGSDIHYSLGLQMVARAEYRRVYPDGCGAGTARVGVDSGERDHPRAGEYGYALYHVSGGRGDRHERLSAVSP